MSRGSEEMATRYLCYQCIFVILQLSLQKTDVLLPPPEVRAHGDERQHCLKGRANRPEEGHHEDGLAAGGGGQVLRVERHDLRR